jgi:hypothetical protein
LNVICATMVVIPMVVLISRYCVVAVLQNNCRYVL